MRNLIIALGIVAAIIVAHLIPALIVTFVPAWILVPGAVVMFIALVRFIIWTARQAWEADR